MDKKKYVHVSVRLNSDIMAKFRYAAKYNERSGSGQMIYLMRSYIDAFEKEHGKITEEDLREVGLEE